MGRFKMSQFNLKLRRNFFLALVTAAGIFSFPGVEIGSPIRVFKPELTELLFSKKENESRVYNFSKPIKKVSQHFSKKAIFKHLAFRQNQSDKIEFDSFSKKKIFTLDFMKKQFAFYSFKTFDEFPFASFQE